MFTLEESALLARLLRFLGWLLIAGAAGVIGWVVYRYIS